MIMYIHHYINILCVLSESLPHMLSNSNATYSKISHPPETTIEERDFEPKAPFHHNDTWIWEAMGDCLPDTDIQTFDEGPPFRPVGKRKGRMRYLEESASSRI